MPGNKISTTALVSGVTDAMLQRTVTLTDADIKALPTAPFTLVPAPGTGKAIVPLAASIIADHTHGIYGLANTDTYLYVGYSSNGEQPLVSLTYLPSPAFHALDNLLANTNAATIMGPNYKADSNGDMSALSMNAGGLDLPTASLTLNVYGQSSDFTGGGAGNSWKVTVFYCVVDL